MADEAPGTAPGTRAASPDPDGQPVLDEAHLARQTFEDRALQRELLALFDAQCDRLLADLASPPGAGVAFAAHTLKGAANAIGAFRVATLADRLEEVLGAEADPPEAAGLVVRLNAAISEARAAIADTLRET